MTATLKIGNTFSTFIEDTYIITPTADERQRFQCDIEDATGAHFTRGQQVVVIDPVLGTRFDGVLNTDKEVPQYPSGIILHSIDCYDRGQFVAGKRTYTRTYPNPTLAGKIVVDQLHDVLSGEGITANYAERFETTDVDWNEGNLSNAIGTLNVVDGDLELATSGTGLTILETTTADFAAGTLTNMVAANNSLQPTTTSAIKATAYLPFSDPSAFLNLIIWQGTKALGTNDVLNYDIWISSTSPEIKGSVYFQFTDNSFTGGLVDQIGNNALSASDASSYAKDTWFTRSCSTSAWNGKTVANVIVKYGGTSQGTYTLFIKNIYLSSAPGSPFFSTTATATQLSPAIVISYGFYTPYLTTLKVVPVYDPALSSRTSTTHSIDAVKLLGNSVVSWAAAIPSGSAMSLAISSDGGLSYNLSGNNVALTNLPPGSNVAGLSLIMRESFIAGADPSEIPTLFQTKIQLFAAPTATKSDITKTFSTQTDWNTGVYAGTSSMMKSLVNGDLTCTVVNRNWNNGIINNQTFFKSQSDCSQSAITNSFLITVPVRNSPPNAFAVSRLDFAGTISDFILDMDITVPTTTNFASMQYIAYRTTYWSGNGNPDTMGYWVYFQQGGGGFPNHIVRGTNSSSTSGATIGIGSTVTPTHIRIVVVGNRHQVFLNNGSVADIDITDSTYTSGQIGLGGFEYQQATTPGGEYGTFSFDNLVSSPPPLATWTGPSTSISSLVTCGSSVISWTELNTSSTLQSTLYVSTSVDGGSTYQQCTNGGPIPNIPPGTTVTGKSVKIFVSMTAADATLVPILRGLTWRVLGAYPGSSGTRTTTPIVNDAIVPIARTVGSGFGTTPDGQAYVQSGTATTSVGSGVAVITNTTGDVHMVPGSRVWTDMEATDRVSISASTINPGLELRYTDANNYYRLFISTTAITIMKRSTSISNTITTLPATYTINTAYRMRFRVVGSAPVLLYGIVWADGVAEPRDIYGTPLWTVTGSD